jgi:hypothetical protein
MAMIVDDFLARRRAAIEEQKVYFSHMDKLSAGHLALAEGVKLMLAAGLDCQEIVGLLRFAPDEIAEQKALADEEDVDPA